MFVGRPNWIAQTTNLLVVVRAPGFGALEGLADAGREIHVGGALDVKVE